MQGTIPLRQLMEYRNTPIECGMLFTKITEKITKPEVNYSFELLDAIPEIKNEMIRVKDIILNQESREIIIPLNDIGQAELRNAFPTGSGDIMKLFKEIKQEFTTKMQKQQQEFKT